MPKKVRELRIQHHLTQQELADQLKVSRGTVVVWERENTKISQSSINRLALFFNVPPDVFTADCNEVTHTTIQSGTLPIDSMDDPLLFNCTQVRMKLNQLTLAQINCYKDALIGLLDDLDTMEFMHYLQAYRAGSPDISKEEMQKKIDAFLSHSNIASDHILRGQLLDVERDTIS